MMSAQATCALRELKSFVKGSNHACLLPLKETSLYWIACILLSKADRVRRKDIAIENLSNKSSKFKLIDICGILYQLNSENIFSQVCINH
jgi:hypothetical protein